MTPVESFSSLPWWQWAADWDAARVGLSHGSVAAALIAFAAGKTVGPTRFRRASAARAAAEEFAADGLIASATELARLPLDDVETLKRLRRFGVEVVRPLLQLALARKLKGQDLLQHEREARAKLGPEPSRAAGAANSHVHRLTAPSFRSEALSLVASDARTKETKLLTTATFAGEVPIDAVLIAPDRSRSGVRFVAASPGGDVRARQREIILYAIAAARFFVKVMLVFQREADAALMASTLAGLGRTGVQVAWHDAPNSTLVWLSRSDKRRPPDLALSRSKSARPLARQHSALVE